MVRNTVIAPGPQSDFEKPSDIQGLVYIPFQNRVEEVSISLIRELSRQGYKKEKKKALMQLLLTGIVRVKYGLD